MITSLALSLIAIASGTLLTYTYDDGAPVASRLCSGACIGFAVMGLLGFILALLMGLNLVTIGVTSGLLLLPFALLTRQAIRNQINADVDSALAAISRATAKPDRWAFIYFFFYAGIAILMWRVFDRALLVKPEGYYTGVLNNYGDLPFHLSVITGFAFGQNYPPEDPTFAGVRFTYPFLTDFISAMFVRAGASLRASLFIENWIIGVALVGILHRFGLRVLRNRTAALLTPALIILNGGVGWWMLFGDINQSEGGIFQVLRKMHHSYTIIPDMAQGWRWGNSVTSLLVPQRGFLLGIPLAVMVFTLWWEAMRDEKSVPPASAGGSKKRLNPPAKAGGTDSNLPMRQMLAAGFIAGLLPLVHAHSFIATMGVAGVLTVINIKRWRGWLIFITVASVIAIPQMLWSTHGSAVSTRAFIGWEFGWGHGNENVLWFWFKNTGFFIPVLIAALLWKTNEYLVPRKLLLFYLPFTLCFIVPNMIKFAPWIWDNIKILFYWWIASAPLVALLLAKLWEGTVGNRIGAIALFVMLTLSGGLDVAALCSGYDQFQEFDREGIVFADMIKQSTPPRATILHAPVHNTPVFLSGRRSLMGYPGHIWTHGIDSGLRESDIKRIYSGSFDSRALLTKYRVDYVVVDPQERSVMQVNDAFFKQFPEVASVGEYHLYKVAP
jgi:preprotein translocase subunit Sss1